MPRDKATLAEERLARDKDRVRAIEAQLRDARLKGGRDMLDALDAGVLRTRLAIVWSTSLSQVDRMIARARSERR